MNILRNTRIGLGCVQSEWGDDYAYDLYTLMLSNREADEKSLHNRWSGWIHERVHWYQHHGTTIGALLSLLQHTQDFWTISGISNLNESERLAIYNYSRKGHSAPLISIDPETYTLIPASHKWSDTFEQLRKDWYVLWATFQALFSTQKRLPGSLTGTGIRMAFSIAANESKLRLNTSNTVLDHLFPNGVRYKLVQLPDGVFFSTRHLFESQAALIELSALQLATGEIQESRELVRSLDNYEYRLAIEIFAMCCDIDSELVVIDPLWRNTFLIAADLALNPPVPPVVMHPERKEFSWLDWFPPHRLIGAARAISFLGPMPKFQENSALIDYMKTVAEIAQLSCIVDQVHPFKSSCTYLDYTMVGKADREAHIQYTSAQTRNQVWNEQVNMELLDLRQVLGLPHRYRLWLQSCFWEYRKQNLAGCVLPMYEWTKYAIPAGSFDMMIQSGPDEFWTTPPIARTQNGNLTIGPAVKPAFGWWVALWSTFSHLLCQTLTTNGDADFSNLPVELRPNSSFFTFAERDLASALGISLSDIA